jgi:hypothetical protein
VDIAAADHSKMGQDASRMRHSHGSTELVLTKRAAMQRRR